MLCAKCCRMKCERRHRLANAQMHVHRRPAISLLYFVFIYFHTASKMVQLQWPLHTITLCNCSLSLERGKQFISRTSGKRHHVLWKHTHETCQNYFQCIILIRMGYQVYNVFLFVRCIYYFELFGSQHIHAIRAQRQSDANAHPKRPPCTDILCIQSAYVRIVRALTGVAYI